MAAKEKAIRAKITRKLGRVVWTRRAATGTSSPLVHLTVDINAMDKQHQGLLDDLRKALKD